MPTFAELRAKAEAAANQARDSANARIADYRGDKKPERPAYKAPPPRPATKPTLPPDASRPRTRPSLPPESSRPTPQWKTRQQSVDIREDSADERENVGGYEVEDEPTVQEPPRQQRLGVKSQTVTPSASARTSTTGISKISSDAASTGEGVQVLLQNKDLFFRFMDEFFAHKGFPITPRPLPGEGEIQVQEAESDSDHSYPGSEEGHEVEVEEEELGIDSVLARSEELSKEDHRATTSTVVAPASSARTIPPVQPSVLPRRVPTPPETPRASSPPSPTTESDVPQERSLPPPRRIPPPLASRPPPAHETSMYETPSGPPTSPPATSSPGVSRMPSRRIPPVPKKPGHLRSPPSSPEPVRESFDTARSISPIPNMAGSVASVGIIPHSEPSPPPLAPRPPPRVNERPVPVSMPSEATLRPLVREPEPVQPFNPPERDEEVPMPAPVPRRMPPAPANLEREEDERSVTPSTIASVSSRLTNVLKNPKKNQRRTPSTSTSSNISATNAGIGEPPPVPMGTRPGINKSTKPQSIRANTRSGDKFAPPSTFFTKETDENWFPAEPFGYMPQAGRHITEGQCSAAQLCSYFAESVPWDFWYSSEDPSARPVAIINRIEARWKGSVVTSQETKSRLFRADKVSTERSRVGVVTFQDLSIAWYRVTWNEKDPAKSLKREARYRAAPAPWNGENLYNAHLVYGQAITDFCERAIRMRQFVGNGEAWDLANTALNEMSRYKPHAAPVIPSVGHCHGHLIYEGLVADGHQRLWGATRGGETAIRNGDIIEWCDAEFQVQDEQGETIILTVGESGYTAVILSSAEFPERLDEDAQTLPPIRLPELEIAIQSASGGMAPTKRIVWFDTMTRGRVWIYRAVAWDYLGLPREPEAEWPPPDPTFFLPPQYFMVD